jgi:3-deoxy-D-manno-octulosonic-acid transferase
MSVGSALYRAFTMTAEPLAPALLRWAARRESAALRAERLGRAGLDRVDTWWHAASLGEVVALEPILERARAEGLAGRVAVTVNTEAGRGAARRLWGERAALAPLDLPRATARAFDARRPRALVLVETELWPNWILAARARGAAIAVVNGRLSDRAWPRYRRWRSFFAPLVAQFGAVAARTELDAERFIALGASPDAVRVTGNAKHDRLATAERAKLPWGDAPLWTVGSLRPGEEAAILDAFARVREREPRLRLALALRHPQDWGTLDADLAGRGWRVARRSRPAAEDARADVLVVDTHGELAGLYAASAVAFVGGTLVPVGGHNVLEAALAGVPVLFGPHLANVAEEAHALIESGGARSVRDADDLAEALGGWLADDAKRRADAAACRAAAEALRGGSARAVAWLAERGVLSRWGTDAGS